MFVCLIRTALQDCKRLQDLKLNVASDWIVRIMPVSTLKLHFSFVFAKSLSESQNEEMLKLSIGTFDKASFLIKFIYYFINNSF